MKQKRAREGVCDQTFPGVHEEVVITFLFRFPLALLFLAIGEKSIGVLLHLV